VERESIMATRARKQELLTDGSRESGVQKNIRHPLKANICDYLPPTRTLPLVGHSAMNSSMG
jgi:hypothetical protein